MSAIVKDLNLRLIAASDLLPDEILTKCFIDTLKELNCVLNKHRLELPNGYSITINIGTRIILTAEASIFKASESIMQQIYELFTRRARILQKNYVDDLQEEIYRKKRESTDLESLNKLIEENLKKIEKSNRALEIQQMDACNAIVEELKIAATQKGYTIKESKESDEVQLQFIRRQY